MACVPLSVVRPGKPARRYGIQVVIVGAREGARWRFRSFVGFREDRRRRDRKRRWRAWRFERQAAGISGADAPPRLPLKVFINYRHEDMPFAASTLYRELKGRFGKENIFFDEGTLRPGMRFLEEIKSHLTGTAGAFIALIGSKWMPTMIAHRRRGDHDYVTEEIELALRNRWTVIPVLVDDASLPDPRELPPAIRALPGCQVARLRQTNLDDDVEDLSRPSERDPCWQGRRGRSADNVDAAGRGDRDAWRYGLRGSVCLRMCCQLTMSTTGCWSMRPTTWSSSSARGSTRTTTRGLSGREPRCSRMTRISRSTLRPRSG